MSSVPPESKVFGRPREVNGGHAGSDPPPNGASINGGHGVAGNGAKPGK
ncbi:MAG: hypothetical protein ABI193_09255 [Minicystis sp.]